MKKLIFIILTAGVFMLSVSALSGCSSAPKDDSGLRNDGYVCATLDCNGGQIGNYKTRYLYGLPGAKILEPGAQEAKLVRAVYDEAHELEGWYEGYKNEDGEVVFLRKWDFKNDKLQEDITLYAKWVEKLRFVIKGGTGNGEYEIDQVIRYFSVYADDSAKTLNRPTSAPEWEEHTFVEYYEDSGFGTPFSFPAVHTGTADNNNTIIIYAKYIEGDYRIVRSAADFTNIRMNTNLYLLSDIDMADTVWTMPDDYRGTIKGDGEQKAISNITLSITQSGSYFSASRFGLFGVLSGARLENVAFENCSVTVNIVTGTRLTYIGLIAGELKDNTVFVNTRIEGTITIVNTAGNPNVNFNGLYGVKSDDTSLDGCDIDVKTPSAE